MQCGPFAVLSSSWVDEKLRCINPNEQRRVREIQTAYQTHLATGSSSFSPAEFTWFLNFKGLARSTKDFLRRYQSGDEVERVTAPLFSSVLNNMTFDDTTVSERRGQALEAIDTLYSSLQQLEYVKSAVASAVLALCFPDLCATADYIVPSLLFAQSDSAGTANPLAHDKTAWAKLRTILRPSVPTLRANEARNLAFDDNYRTYVQELWAIKTQFGLQQSVREIEVSLWSFGICYCKQKDRTAYNSPIVFRSEPEAKGQFSKHCPNR